MPFNSTLLAEPLVTDSYILPSVSYKFISVQATAVMFSQLRRKKPDVITINQLIGNTDIPTVAETRHIPIDGKVYLIYFPCRESYVTEITIPEHYASIQLEINGITNLSHDANNTGAGSVDLSNYYDRPEMDALLAGKALEIHGHSQYALQSALDALQNVVDNLPTSNYTQAQSDLLYPSNAEFDAFIATVDTALLAKSPISHDHNDLYYIKAQVYTIPQVDALLAALTPGGYTVPEFSFSFVGDTLGLFYHLGRDATTGYWSNPAIANKIAITSSGWEGGSLSDLVNRTLDNNFSSANVAQPWVTVDLLTRQFQPSGYAMRQRPAGSNNIRHWRLQASNDNATWTTLDETKTPLGDAVWIYRPAAAAENYRYFRWQMLSQTLDNAWYFCPTELELYGDLV